MKAYELIACAIIMVALWTQIFPKAEAQNCRIVRGRVVCGPTVTLPVIYFPAPTEGGLDARLVSETVSREEVVVSAVGAPVVGQRDVDGAVIVSVNGVGKVASTTRQATFPGRIIPLDGRYGRQYRAFNTPVRNFFRRLIQRRQAIRRARWGW